MSKQKREKLAVTVTPEKTRQDKTFIQIEGKLTPRAIRSDRWRTWGYS